MSNDYPENDLPEDPIDDETPRFVDDEPDFRSFLDVLRRHEDHAASEPPPSVGLPPSPYDEDIQDFLSRTGQIDEAERILGTPPEPPPPEDQSAFVNPVMSRVKARQRSRGQNDPSEIWLGLRTLGIVTFAAVIIAFIFSYWTPNSFLPESFVANLQNVSSTQGPPTLVPSPLPTFAQVDKIGIITGHAGPPLDSRFSVDPGAICDDNGDGTPELTELEINQSVAQRVATSLVQRGYEVELLNEWDARIDNYRASTLISIHTNTCQQFAEGGATGFNVKASERQTAFIERDKLLVDCIVARYSNATGLARHFGSPPDLVDYHVFRKVSVDTPTVIIELGFMFADRAILTGQPDAMASGIVDGLECFLNPQNNFVPTEVPSQTGG